MSEAFSSSAEFTSATPGEEVTEACASSGAFVSGVLVTYGYDILEVVIEELESAGSFVSGTLVERLRSINAPVEALESLGSFVSGAMTDPLIFYDNWPLQPDELESEGSFVSGALT
jgi:hypothetical protein